MLHYLLIPFLFFSLLLHSQQDPQLNPEERAYLFHIVRKSPILEQNIGRYFEYSGPDLRFMNKEINYDSIESLIIVNPELLNIRQSEIAKSPKGIMAEAANKMALWELNKTLLAARLGEKEIATVQKDYDRFAAILLPLLPDAAFKISNHERKLHSKLLAVLNPGLSFNDKTAMLATFNFLSPEEQLQVIEAMNTAVNQYAEQRSFEIFRALGGTADIYENTLVAAGDGSETSGMLNEREKDETGRWNKGLPKAVGFFPYQPKLEKKSREKDSEITASMAATVDYETVGNNKLTQLHFDVWGYNGEKQTTVVIEKNGLSYHLFGSGDTRFLSPDSTFSKGKTYQAVINELQFGKIKELNEKIYGKRGYDYQIEETQKKKDETELKINKEEHNYSNMTSHTITTSSKAPKSVKKAKKKGMKGGGSEKENEYQPNTDSGKAARGGEQQDIVSLWSRYEQLKKQLEELKKEKQLAIDLLARYQQRLDNYKSLIGYRWATYTEKDGLYLFEDSSTFDIYTQEFTFRPDSAKTGFEVRLLAIPTGPLSDQADEVMLHVNLTDAAPGFDARLQLNLVDVFSSNNWKLERTIIAPADSVAVRQLFEALLDKKLKFSAVARGEGVGVWNGAQVIKQMPAQEWDSYPGGTAEKQSEARMSESYQRLRSTEVSFSLNRGIKLEINTFTDPVRTSLKPSDPEITQQFNRYRLTGNDYLSGLRTATVISKLKQELNILAGTYLSREEAKVVIDRLNKELDRLRVSIGPTSFSWQELLSQK